MHVELLNITFSWHPLTKKMYWLFLANQRPMQIFSPSSLVESGCISLHPLIPPSWFFRSSSPFVSWARVSNSSLFSWLRNVVHEWSQFDGPVRAVKRDVAFRRDRSVWAAETEIYFQNAASGSRSEIQVWIGRIVQTAEQRERGKWSVQSFYCVRNRPFLF
jgi:hypothetical protein